MTLCIHNPVTDDLPICVRAYATNQGKPSHGEGSKPNAPTRAPLKASGWSVIFDTETTTDASQSLRFGTYQVRKENALSETGIFYDPAEIDPKPLAALSAYAEENAVELLTRDEFADRVIFGIGWKLGATIIGFNLPFDVSRIAIGHGSARTAMRGGFTFKLSRQKIFPNIQIKHLSRRAAFIRFAKPMGQMDPGSMRKRRLRSLERRGHFVDVKTLAGALFERSFSLADLSSFLGIAHPKIDFDAFDGPIDSDMIAYAVRDVQATWDCYVELNDRLEQLGLSELSPEKVYSAASLGKGCLREMGITPWRKMQPDFPDQMLANIMGSYFGGRSEVRIRRELRQVILCDFLSMYPTVCTLMGLWKFVVAQGMTWRDSTSETKDLLSKIDLAPLQKQDTWKGLTTLVRVKAEADIFPVRAKYEGDATSTIGLNFLSAGQPLWFTLADCIASKLQTGKPPKILRAVTFEPGPIQEGLKPFNISGNAQYKVDPENDDLFKRMIELRQFIKSQMAKAKGEAHERLDIEQYAIKILANSTSYGIYVEVNVADKASSFVATVCSSTSEPFDIRTDKAEEPGPFFHPLLAALITGAARLMLAITERLISDYDLEWAFCDTDSMAIAKPEGMADAAFQEKVASIVAWFENLNPYESGGSILKIEDVNRELDGTCPRPLYCWAVSSKRYALFNLASDGSPIVRKVSAHGLGHLISPYEEDDAPKCLPTPHKSVLRDGVQRWHADLWFGVVEAALAGTPDQLPLDYHTALNEPALSCYSATSPELLKWFKRYNADKPYREQVRPFGFLTALSARPLHSNEKIVETEDGRPRRGRRPRPRQTKPVTTYGRNRQQALAQAFDRNTGRVVSPEELQTYSEALASYHLHPESKFLNGDYLDRGTTRRRHVSVLAVTHIGKESHDWERQAFLGVHADSIVDYGFAQVDVLAQLRALVTDYGIAAAAKALAVSKPRLKTLLGTPDYDDASRFLESIASQLPTARLVCAETKKETHAELERLRAMVSEFGPREAGRRLGVDPSNLRRKVKL